VDGWQWLLWIAVPLGIIAALFGLDRLALWLEDRGWLYYRRKKPASSPLSSLVALQQYLESGVKHVRQAGRECRDEDREAVRERLLARLLRLLETTPANVEKVRHGLAAAKRASLDWEQLYGEAVRVAVSLRPERAGLIPSPEDVAPAE
jgi:hypothetical protein